MRYKGILSAAQLIQVLDGLTTVFDTVYPALGLGKIGETGTATASALSFKTSILGDGTTTNPGLGNSYQQDIAGQLDALISYSRYDTFWSRMRTFIASLDANVQVNIPASLIFSSVASRHFTNSLLLRINAAHAGVPVTPATAGVLTAGVASGGALPLTVVGSAPRVVHTLIGANDYDESLPCPEATQVAIAGSNNSYTYQVAGSVPAGVKKIAVYRGYVGGATSIYYLDQVVSVAAGLPYPAVTLKQSDTGLRDDWSPPAWLSCLLKPEAAAIMALAYSVSGVAVASSLTSVNMISETNVSLAPATGYLGIGNPVQNALFGVMTVGTGFVAGTVQTTNDPPNSIQGFAGSIKLRARVTTVLNAAGSATVTYTYYSAAGGYGTVNTATSASATFSAAAVGTTLSFTIPAGRLIVAVTAVTPTGITSGVFVVEAEPVR